MYTASITLRLERRIDRTRLEKDKPKEKPKPHTQCHVTHLLASSPPGGRLGMLSDANVRMTWTRSGTPSSPCFLRISGKQKVVTALEPSLKRAVSDGFDKLFQIKDHCPPDHQDQTPATTAQTEKSHITHSKHASSMLQLTESSAATASCSCTFQTQVCSVSFPIC